MVHTNSKHLLGYEGVSVDNSEKDYLQSFLEACKENDTEQIIEILESADFETQLNRPDPDTGATGLMLTSINGNIEIVKILIGLGVDLDAKDLVYGWTALMQSTFYGQKEIVKFLLKAGADPTLMADNGCNALDLAMLIEENDPQIIRLLAQETVLIAPPLMSLLPLSRPVSKLTRSISTPMISSEKKSDKGIKKWWEKFSSIFKTSTDQDQVLNSQEPFSHSLNINVIPPEEDIQESLKTMNLDDSDENLTFTHGFTAGVRDLTDNGLIYVQPPDEKPMIILEHYQVSKSPFNSIDTLKLLSNYNRNKPPLDIEDLLSKLGLDEYSLMFQEHEIDLETFQMLKSEDLHEIGISDPVTVKRLMSAKKSIKKFQN